MSSNDRAVLLDSMTIFTVVYIEVDTGQLAQHAGCHHEC